MHSKQKEPFNFNHSVIQLFSLFKKTDPPKEDALDSLFLMPFRYTLVSYRTNATVRKLNTTATLAQAYYNAQKLTSELASHS